MKKKKVGRPKKAAKDKKTKITGVRMTEKTYKELCKKYGSVQKFFDDAIK